MSGQTNPPSFPDGGIRRYRRSMAGLAGQKPVSLRAARMSPLAFIVLAFGVACGAFERDPSATQTPDDLLTIVTITTEPTPTPRSTAITYTVQEGDTLTSIAEEFEVSQDAIIEANNLANPDAIQAGQQLIIPPPVTVESSD